MRSIESILEPGEFKEGVDFIKDDIKKRHGFKAYGSLVLFGIVHVFKQSIEEDYKDDWKKGEKYSVSVKDEGAIGDAIYFETAVGCDKVNSVEFDMPYMSKFGFSPDDVIRGVALVGEVA